MRRSATMPCDDGEKDKDFESNSFTHQSRPLVGGKKVVVDLSRFEKWPPPKPVLLSFFLSFFPPPLLLPPPTVLRKDRQKENGVTKFDWIGCFSSRFFPQNSRQSFTLHDFQKRLAAPVVVVTPSSGGTPFESA